MKLSDFSENWPRTIAILLLTGFLFWGWACPAQVESLRTPGRKIGRAELQVELDTIIATAEFKMADLDTQEQFRDIIFKNAMVMVEAGAMNPAGIIVLLTSLYGITRGAKDIKDRVKKKSAV